MELETLLPVVEKIKGCSFASLDTRTHPRAGFTKVTTGLSVILFSAKSSGYEAMVNRRLAELGLEPSFTASDLPFGDRIEAGSPILFHQGEYYLQTIPIRPGVSECFMHSIKIPCECLGNKIPEYSSQGLPKDRRVFVNTFKLSSILAIRLMGEALGQREGEMRDA